MLLQEIKTTNQFYPPRTGERSVELGKLQKRAKQLISYSENSSDTTT